MEKAIQKLALIVRQGPFQGRSGRDQMDLALSAATLGIELDLVFTAQGLLQLLPADEQSVSAMPGGAKGWKSLPGLTLVRAWSTHKALGMLTGRGNNLLLDVQTASPSEISARLNCCDLVLIL